MAWHDNLKDIAEVIINLDKTIGFKRVILYIIVILCIIGLFNFKSIVKGSIEFITELNEEIHSEKMEKRDELLRDLTPILQEFRVSTGADRILYFEYHNSKENLVGIPFKYIDLVLQNSRYGIPRSPEVDFRDINVGIITGLYEDIKLGDIIICNGDSDILFKNNYPGTFEQFHESDGSQQLAFISIPGIKQPVGIIVLEWLNLGTFNPGKLKEIERNSNSFISRINGLIMSKM